MTPATVVSPGVDRYLPQVEPDGGQLPDIGTFVCLTIPPPISMLDPPVDGDETRCISAPP